MRAYLDGNSTTPLDARVATAVGRFLAGAYGNPSSRDHQLGWDAAAAVEEARGAVADALGASAYGVVFTSGSTEALNTVLRSYVGFDGWGRKAIVTAATEHSAVLEPARFLAERTGVRLTVLPVDGVGRVDIVELSEALAQTPGALVALAAANGEIGTLHDVRAVADAAHAAGALFLCDATQAVGKLPVDLGSWDVDFAALSAHKLYGPKGVGALVTRDRRAAAALDPLILGGGQERGLRGGTLNVPGIVGFGEACRLVTEGLDDDVRRMRSLRDHMESAILAEVPDSWVNGDRASRLCNTANMGFRGLDARALIRDMHDVACSTRSACSSGDGRPSHVLKAVGLSDADAYSCIRFTLGRFTTQDDVDYAAGKVVASVHTLRGAKSVRA